MNSAQLLQAYLDADYRPAVAGCAPLRVGRRCGALAARFPEVAHFALLTAWNPDSRALDPDANLAAERALDKALADSGIGFVPAMNLARDGRHAEASRLLLDAGDHRLDALACRFGQAGALAWKAGRAVRLRLYRPQWRAAAGAGVDTRFIDWVACPPP